MGAWGRRAFDNDTANDWAYELERFSDLALVEAAFDDVDQAKDGYVDQDVACNALAACEVLARCQGNAGYTDAYTRKVDDWVDAHPQKLPAELVARAAVVIDRITSATSELRSVWEGDGDWLAAVNDLRGRLGRSA